MKRLVVLLLLIVACGVDTPTVNTNPVQDLDSTWGIVEEIRLSDGTACAIIRSGTGSGISCNWGER